MTPPPNSRGLPIEYHLMISPEPVRPSLLMLQHLPIVSESPQCHDETITSRLSNAAHRRLIFPDSHSATRSSMGLHRDFATEAMHMSMRLQAMPREASDFAEQSGN